MSLHTASTIDVLVDRVAAASKSSQIALFKSRVDGQNAIEAVFNNTVVTQARIKKAGTGFVGSFYGKAGAKKAELAAMVNMS